MPSRLRALSAVPLCVMLLCAAPAGGGEDGPTVAVRSQNLRVSIAGRAATTTMDLVFVNYTDEQQEAVYQWRMSPEAAAHDLALWVDGARSPAALHSRSASRIVYERIVNDRRDPALLEYLGRGLWNLRVFPVPAGKTQKVQVVFSHILPIGDEGLVYTVPRGTPSCSAQIAQVYDFSARVRCPGGVKDLSTYDRKLGVQRHASGEMTVGFREEMRPVIKKFTLHITPGRAAPEVLTFGEGDDRRFLAMVPVPEWLTGRWREPRNIVLVVDTSASMEGFALHRAKAGAEAILAKLEAGDRFGLVVCGAEPKLWKDKLVDYNGHRAGEALADVRKLRPAGGTDLAGALRAAESLQSKDTPVDIVLITDGWEQMTCKPPRSTRAPGKGQRLPPPKPKCRVFVLGVAGRVEAMADLAEATDGLALFVYQTDAVALAAKALLRRAAQARMGKLLVEPGAGTAAEGKAPAAMRDLAWGWSGPGYDAPIVITGDRAGPPGGRIALKLSATVNGKRREATFDLKPGAGSRKGDDWGAASLQRCSAHLVCDRMYDRRHRKDVKLKDVEAVMKLGRRHHIATRCLSLIVLESDEEYEQLGIDRGVTLLDRALSVTAAEEGRQAMRAERKAREARENILGPDDPTPGNSRALRVRLLELIRLGKYDRASRMIEEDAERDVWAGSVGRVEPAVREFLAIRRRMADAEEDVRQAAGGDDAVPWHLIASRTVPRQRLTNAADEDVEVVAIPPPRHTRTKKALRKQARPLAIKDKTLKEAVELFEKASGTPLCVRWEALEAIAVYRKTEVTVDLPAAPAEQTLRRLLAAIKAPKPLDFGVCGEDVVVSTKAEVAALPIGRVYDIRPILSRVANYGQRTPDNWPDWYEWPPSEGVFGGSRGGIFDEDTTGGADGPSVVPMAVSVIADDDPTAEIDYAGVVEILKKDKVSYKPVGGSAAPDDGVFREDGFDDDKYWPQRRPYPDEGQVFTMLTSFLYRSIGLKREPFSSIGVMGRDGPTGLIAVYQPPVGHRNIHGVLRSLNAKLRRGEVPAPLGSYAPESLFMPDATVCPWVVDVLTRARDGKLNEHSSIEVKAVAGRTLARIGGTWFDTALTDSAPIHVVARKSAAARALLEADPRLAECLDLLGPVILAAGGSVAIGLDERGIFRRDHPDLAKLLTALRAGR